MTFYEKLVEKAKEMGYPNATKFFDAAEVNTNARQALKKTGRLSDTYKMRIARVLKCSVGDINRMMSEARAEELKKDWPDKAQCSPVKLKEEPEPIPESQPEPIPEAEPFPEPVIEPQPETPTEDQILEGKIEDIKAKADVLLTYHDRIRETAKAVLAKEYADMLRKQMLFVAVTDLADLCSEFLSNRNPHKAAAFIDVASEILKLKEEE